jgi:CAAX protease family protein
LANVVPEAGAAAAHEPDTLAPLDGASSHGPNNPTQFSVPDSMTTPAGQPSHYLQWARLGKPGFFRYLAGALLALSISLFFGQIFSVVGALVIPSQSVAATIVKITFFGFIVSFLLIPLIPVLLNRRPWWSIAMPARKIEATNLVLGAGIAIATMVVLNVIAYLIKPNAYHFEGLDPGSWIPMLLVAAVAFFVQASTEEMVYRGYLAQFVAAFTRSPILILGIPALLFALPHFGNIAGSSGFLGLLPYVLMGLMYGVIAWRSGSLWMGAGVHLGNNWFITMFVGNAAEGFPKVSLFTTHGSSSAVELVVSILIQGLVVVGLAEVLMRRFRLTRSRTPLPHRRPQDQIELRVS